MYYYPRVRFLNGGLEEQYLVQSVVEDHVNTLRIPIRFLFMGDDYRGPSHIRINLDSLGSSWSLIGLGTVNAWGAEPTMTLNLYSTLLAAETERTILHDFGHALGLLHQHQHPDCGLEWNKLQLKRRYGVSDSFIQTNYCAKMPCPVSMPYDPDSVMHYKVEVGDAYGLTRPICPGIGFSRGDESRLRLMYPTGSDIFSWPRRRQLHRVVTV